MITFQNRQISEEEIVTTLKYNFQLKDICHQIIYQDKIQKLASELELIVTPEEIQIEADRRRYRQRLIHIQDTLNWLNDALMSPEDWEKSIYCYLLTKKLAEKLFKNQVEQYFQENIREFEQIVLYQIVVPYELLAQEIFYQIEEAEMSFYEAAHLYDISENRRRTCGYEGIVYRRNLHPDLAKVAFSGKVGEVIAPICLQQTSHILLVEDFIPAELTTARYEEILNHLLQNWLNSDSRG